MTNNETQLYYRVLIYLPSENVVGTEFITMRSYQQFLVLILIFAVGSH